MVGNIMNTIREYEILYDNKQYMAFKVGKFIAKQKKNKHGILLEKVYLYTNNGGAADYYDTTAFATFSSIWHMQQFIDDNTPNGRGLE